MATQILTKEAGRAIYRVSVLAVLTLIGFFMLLRLIGWVHIVELRFFNLIILAIAIRRILNDERIEGKNRLEFLSGLMHGTFASMLIALGFTSFVFFYLSYIDTGLMAHIQATQPFGHYLNPLSSSLIVLIEGVASGIIISFAMLWHYSKES